MNLKKCTQSDIEDIQDFVFNLWKDFFDAGEKEQAITKRPDLENPVDFYLDKNGQFWVLRDSGEIIATIGVHEILFEGKKVGFLRRLFIDKNHRSKGLGGKMLQHVEEFF